MFSLITQKKIQESDVSELNSEQCPGNDSPKVWFVH